MKASINNVTIINNEFFFKDSKGGLHDLWEDPEENITTVEINGKVYFCNISIMNIEGEDKIVYTPFEESPLLP